MEKKTYPTYEEAKIILKKNGINLQKDYKKYYKELGLPSNPNRYYKDSGWISWYDLLSKKAPTPFPTYEEAMHLVHNKGIRSLTEYKLYYEELGLPAAPESVYKEWIGWPAFLGKRQKEFPSYEEAQKKVFEKGIKSQSDYHNYFKELGLPAAPSQFYKDNWVSWFAFLGKSPKVQVSYDEAHRIVQQYGIKSAKEYWKSYKQLGLPSSPQRDYKDSGWENWQSFFGKASNSFPATYEEAKKVVQNKGIKSLPEYRLYYKQLGLPSRPYSFYKDSGWVDWFDFLGKSKQTSQEDRKYNLFKKFAINPVLLKDAPLKVLYIYFSKFRRITDGITSLLGTSSYEERLNWVKEQLNSLKDGSLSKDKSSEEPDELSAMESLIEENDDVRKSLSEEESERFKIIWENYVHGVINRELISESDD